MCEPFQLPLLLEVLFSNYVKKFDIMGHTLVTIKIIRVSKEHKTTHKHKNTHTYGHIHSK